ncbi:MAG: hypothetical protein Q9159_003233 [Coniocarpon cinnabarinum]
MYSLQTLAPLLALPWLANANALCGPYQPSSPIPTPQTRSHTCSVAASGDGSDDSQAFVSAIADCNNGGHVLFEAGQSYTIGTALDLTYLSSIDIEIAGVVQFTNDTDYWQANSFRQIFQNATTFFQLGGKDVNFYTSGDGELNGNGQVWYDLYAQDDLILRPILVGVIGLHDSTVGPLKCRYSPQYYNFVANSTNVVFTGYDISGFSKSENVAKNTDGFDTYRSSNLVIQNSTVNNGDDCVSFKPNSTQVLVQNMYCNGSHGISVGSLGQYAGETDIVEDIYVYNISMFNASDGARIKVWPGNQAALSPDLQGGGGTGSVKNVTYEGMKIQNVDYAIEVTQCYGQNNRTLCNEAPSNLTISDVVFKDFSGATSGARDPIVGTVVCSSPNVCSDIMTSNIDVVSPNGYEGFECSNVDETQLGLNCTQ